MWNALKLFPASVAPDTSYTELTERGIIFLGSRRDNMPMITLQDGSVFHFNFDIGLKFVGNHLFYASNGFMHDTARQRAHFAAMRDAA